MPRLKRHRSAGVRRLQLDLPQSHAGQQLVRTESKRFNVLACGRRWGKTTFGGKLAIETAMGGKPVAWFAPIYKMLLQSWLLITELLDPIAPVVEVRKSDRIILFHGGGSIQFWTLERPGAGRGYKYARAIIDEATMARDLEIAWTKAIRPTLADYRGDAWFLSTPLGHDYFHQLWSRGQLEQPGWASWQMPTSTNPHIDPEEIEAARLELPAAAFDQEWLAQFLSDASNPFGLEAIDRQTVAALEPGPAVCYGVDFAKSIDYTVVVGLNAAGGVCHLERYQVDWKQTYKRVAGVIGHVPTLADSTGISDPIVEQLQRSCTRCEGYTFSERSRQQLLEALAAAIQQGDIRFPEGYIPAELKLFRFEYSRRGVKYRAPETVHDDCVMALGLATLCYLRRPRPLVLDAGGAVTADRPHWTDPSSELFE